MGNWIAGDALAGSVRAVVVTWNGAALLPACLDSLLSQIIPDERCPGEQFPANQFPANQSPGKKFPGKQFPRQQLEVLVVDNGSTDDTLALLAGQYPQVRVLALPENLGFAGGIAAGTVDLLTDPLSDIGDPHLGRKDLLPNLIDRPSQGNGSVPAPNLEPPQFVPEYIALLNNDARFAPDAIGQLIRAIDPEPTKVGQQRKIGAATALVLLDEQPTVGIDGEASIDPLAEQSGLVPTINSTGNIVTPQGAATDRDYGLPFTELPTDPAHREVFGFNGGAALLRVAALREVGGFDPSLFLYYEDTDLSFRLRRAGWDIVFAPEAVAWHRHMATSGGETSPVFRYYNTRNSIIIAARYLPVSKLFRSVARQTLGLIRHWILRDESALVRKARSQGLAAGLRAVPLQWGRRHPARSQRENSEVN